ncbi:MAG: hypothetical protein ABFD86_22185 [Bryobacteraceae bacterium]
MSTYCTSDASGDTLPDIAGAPSVRLLEAAGFRPDVSDTHAFKVTCPCCGGDLGVDGDRVYCAPWCKLGQGRLADALAYELKCSHRGLRERLERRAGWLTRNQRWRERASRYLGGASLLHWVNLMARGFIIPHDNIDLSRLRSWSEKTGIAPLVNDRTAVLLDAATTSRLVERVTGIPGPRHCSVALFHWRDEVTPVSVTIAGPYADTRRIDLQKFAVAVTGLHLASPSRRLLWSDVSRVLANRPGTARNDAWISGGGEGVVPVPAAVVDRGERADWSGWGRLAAGCTNCVVLSDGVEISFQDWLGKTLIRLTDGDVWPPDASAVVECLAHVGGDKVVAELTARGRAYAARCLRERLLHAVVWSDDKHQLRRNESGMLLKDRRVDSDREICNFSLDAVRNIVFPETSEVVHELQVNVRDSRFIAGVSATELHTSPKLQDALRMGAAKHGCDVLPMISDHAAGAKYLLPWLRRRCADAPQVLGRALLGWNPERTVFQGNSWRLTEDTWSEGEVILMSLPAFECFDTGPVPSDGSVAGLSQPSRDILAMIAGMVARFHVRSKVRAICVQNSPAARALCRALFRGFGQVRELELSAIRGPSILQGVQGHPLLASGGNAVMAEALPACAVVLSDTGYVVRDFDEAEAQKLTACARWALQKIAEWLLVTGGREVEEKHAFRYSLALMEEGAAALRKAADLDAWDTTVPEFPSLRKLVADVSPADAHRRFLLIDETSARIFCAGAARPTDLAIELMLLGIPAKDEDGSLVVPAAPLITLLQDYWGESPLLVEPESV